MGLSPRIETIEAGTLTNGIKGKTNGAAIAAGYVGEKLTASLSNVSLVTTGISVNAGSISLTAGTWLVYGKLMVSPPGATLTYTDVSISTSSVTQDITTLVRDLTTTLSLNRYLSPSPKYLSLSATTTVYLVVEQGFTGAAGGTNAANSQFYAVRIA